MVRHLFEGKDMFFWLPTRFGKSVCYKLLPFVIDYKLGRHKGGQRSSSTVIVVLPLVLLMIDQVASLRNEDYSRFS